MRLADIFSVLGFVMLFQHEIGVVVFGGIDNPQSQRIVKISPRHIQRNSAALIPKLAHNAGGLSSDSEIFHIGNRFDRLFAVIIPNPCRPIAHYPEAVAGFFENNITHHSAEFAVESVFPVVKAVKQV